MLTSGNERLLFVCKKMTKRNKTSAAKETVYDRCAYVGCYNGKFINDRRLFHFPAETDRRLEMWIERSGNFRLRTWAATSLRKAGLCADHFDEKSFTDPSRKALRRNVVPRHYTEDLKYRKASEENRENNENDKDIIQSNDEDDPMNCDRSSPTGDFIIKEEHFTDTIYEESSMQSEEYIMEEPCRKAPRLRSPSPVVEFIVEELDESLICDQSQSPNEESIFEEEEEEEEEKERQEQELKEEQDDKVTNEKTMESPMTFEERRKETKPIIVETGLRVNKSTPGVRTYYRSKHHRQMSSEESQQLSQEFSSDESEIISDEENILTPLANEIGENMPNVSKIQVIRPKDVLCSNKNHEKLLLNLRNENKQLRKVMRLLKQNLRRSKAREANYMRVRDMIKNIDEFLNIQECTNPVARGMVKLALHKHKTPYEKEEKNFATQLYRSSSAAFLQLRRAGCNFPGKSTMKRWIADGYGEASMRNFITNETEGLDDDAEKAVDVKEAVHVEEAFDLEEEAIDVKKAIDDMHKIADCIDEPVDTTNEVILEMHEEVVVDVHEEAIDDMNGTVDEAEEAEEAIDDMNEFVEDAEEAIDELVEDLEAHMDNAEDHASFMEALPPDDDEVDLK